MEGEEIAPGRQPADRPSSSRTAGRAPIGFGATLSTIDGVGVTAFWVHRNLFGRAEQLRFDAGVDGLGGSLNPDDYDYNLGVTFTKPGVFNPDTNFVTSLDRAAGGLRHLPRAVGHGAGRLLAAPSASTLTGSIFARPRGRATRTTSASVTSPSSGSSAPAQYDRRDDPLDATRGYYLAADGEAALRLRVRQPDVQATVEGRAYKGFGEERQGRPRRAADGRQLRRPGRGARARRTCCSSPAAAARCAATPTARSASSTATPRR